MMRENQQIKELLRCHIPNERLLENEPMSNHTSFKIGGPVDFLVLPETTEEIQSTVKMLKREEIPFMIIGNASNLIVRDKGIRGVVIKLGESYNRCRITGEEVWAQSGILLSRLAKKVAQASLKGMEFASGIPGSLGGAVYMNAGAYGGEMKDIVTSVTALNQNADLIELPLEKLEMGYRSSILQKLDYAVLEVAIKLEKGDQEQIFARIKELDLQRTTKQPIQYPSAGSVFKRPEGYYAGKLIQDCNLKGYTVGGAQVSTLHCGFIVNRGNATAKDVLDLISKIQHTVKKEFDVDLEREVRVIGEE